ncbi:expansin EXLX1 family cellulose-binding protein [Actinoplanes sp. CA-030573]|uniref:expansin EXLX1 family cellulose-binding protein n=1 Tax=Actinoplanes sp. CA-030573 TaxID=3239898 RepID=UPI003D935810
MTGSRVLSPRWLAAGGAVVLAAALGVALLLQNTGSACAAPPSTSAKTGKATFYDLGDGTGNCSFPSSPADDLFVALGPDQYSAGAACGTYLDVTGPKGKVRVKVTDSCPECAAGHLDLSRTAFKKIGAEVDGIIPITYKTVTGVRTPAPISVRVKEGSSQYWLAVLIDNHGNQLRSVTVNGKATHREDYNYWVIDGGAGSGPFKIKISDVYGHSTVASGIRLTPGATQKTSVRLVGGGSSATARTTAAATPSKAKKKASPSPSPSSAAPTASSAAPALESTEVAAPTGDVEVPPAQEAVDLAAGRAHC